ncbi:MAG TPA: hypothetical protein VG055_27680 [Planctomycetaceae bacterium]|jgi:hypothetical protein|nr:hypothetical protein [Planctomycetaceae bacterium]
MSLTNLIPDVDGNDEEDDGSTGCLLCVAFVVAWLISAGFTLREIRYWVFGRTIDASVIRVQPPVASEDSEGAFEIRYSFIDPSSKDVREETDSVPASWGPPPPGLTVQYIAGRPGTSRILGNRSNVAIWIFAITSLCVVGGFAYLYIDAKRALAPHHASGRGPRRKRRRRWLPKIG